ncbi:hypothetical protein [Tenacibaculum sp. 190524A02b]|uniref:hypothetical protein n=1 Tax=Tenacibaculum vairaonense TaxID=3137860 RepID=UPI0032B13D80
MMKLFFSTASLKSDFELIDLTYIFSKVFKDDNLIFKIYQYEYNGVKDNWKNINPRIIDFLENENSEYIRVEYNDFIKFAKFINQTENGFFIVSNILKNLDLEVEVFDSYFWSISSKNKDILKEIMRDERIINFNPELENAVN